ncbi:hypothetical protein J7T55_007616 [Diaporthe amygdali]|uniref:uncharacterized protein n=1 Tax=Phomopsis amygdali TaxID=1214568 RepID=UPI0022FE5CF5|nr:uncharacterized protein J7T55_007616 [Diaporthe amygdali]KAJ0107246.1 hypothetical protein J7T55_007616 [Diaporthe amygdali]
MRNENLVVDSLAIDLGCKGLFAQCCYSCDTVDLECQKGIIVMEMTPRYTETALPGQVAEVGKGLAVAGSSRMGEQREIAAINDATRLTAEERKLKSLGGLCGLSWSPKNAADDRSRQQTPVAEGLRVIGRKLRDHEVAERHRPRDFLLHYLGCEQFFQREDYLRSLSPEQAKQVDTRLQRIQYLRSVLENDLGEGRQLVQNLTNSLASWRMTKDFQEGISRVRELRKMHFAANGFHQKEVPTTGRYQEYNPDLDTNAYLIRFKDGRLVRDIADNRYHEQFPCYRISMHDLIYGSEEDNAFIPPKGTINYFHFPANNMLMPYPHWDTARHQAKISDAVQKEEEKYKRDKILNEQRLRGMRRVRQRGLQLLNAQSRQPGTEWRLENRDPEKPRVIVPTPPKRTATGAFANIMKRQGRFGKLPLWSVFSTDGTGRVIAGTEIGQVLFDAAVLYEAMSTHREKRLIRKYLHSDPPLHPRRTLEQTNEWTLSLSWHASARDQVVHRATRPKQLDFHSVDPFTKEWRDRIRKLPRVMMIDQLWMWILDDQTIFTCFPDHGDLSHHNHLPGIHSRIRDAVLKNGKGSVRTVSDLAFPQDGTILVMQLFRQAIRDVAAKHSFGAEQYWEWARIFSRLAHTDVDNGLSDLIVPFLDIGKEGELQGQIKSVVRDLEIVLHITLEQLEVYQKFERSMLQFSRGKATVNMEPLLSEVENCIQDLEDMRRTADGISASLDYLISLKQQQVTVVQAWQSMKEAEDTRKQNVTLLVFTVVTVVFLPMSFISSVFGMNNKEIAGRDSPMTLADQFKWMMPISFSIVAITYYLAFGNPWRVSRDLFRWVYMKCGMYQIFAPRDITLSSLRDRYKGRSKRKEAEQAWERRRSAQMARDNQERRAALRRPAVVAQHTSEAISPDTPIMTPASTDEPSTGMFAVYQEMTNMAGKIRTPN